MDVRMWERLSGRENVCPSDFADRGWKAAPTTCERIDRAGSAYSRIIGQFVIPGLTRNPVLLAAPQLSGCRIESGMTGERIGSLDLDTGCLAEMT
jgi:hypothetical protein